MPWQCTVCGEFSAENRGLLLNHIGRCHRNDPNFHCLCGIDGCTRTFKKYHSWRKHVTQKHSDSSVENDYHMVNMDLDNLDEHTCSNEFTEENVEDPTRSAALYILKMQEDCSLPKSTVASIISNTKTILEETLSSVHAQVKAALNNANVDDQNIPWLQEIFEENPATNPFHNLETEAQQRAYYTENFGLKVIYF